MRATHHQLVLMLGLQVLYQAALEGSWTPCELPISPPPFLSAWKPEAPQA